MSYTKNIAVIKQLKDGFSSDGGKLSGLVKVEKYGSKLKAEVTLLNFAPVSEGRIICAVSDGTNTQIVENCLFEGESNVDTVNGFAALICYVNGGVFPIASAICGNYHFAVLGIKAEVERLENIKTVKKPSDSAISYEDEAIAEDNYYEYEDNESQDTLREDKEKKENGQELRENEEAVGAVKERSGGINEKLPPEYASVSNLAGGNFFEKVKGEVEKIFENYPAEENLQELIEGSRWAKINYGGDSFYVFGVLYTGGNAEYFCYGVPTNQSSTPPESMKDLASFVPASAEDTQTGYWIMYQDARTGASVKINNI